MLHAYLFIRAQLLHCVAINTILCRRVVSVCVSVRLSRSWILSKRINISSNIFFTFG